MGIRSRGSLKALARASARRPHAIEAEIADLPSPLRTLDLARAFGGRAGYSAHDNEEGRTDGDGRRSTETR